MSDPKASSAGHIAAGTTKSYQKNLPKIMQGINELIQGNELAKLQSAELTAPRYSTLNTQLANTMATSVADNDANILDTSGRRRAGIATEIDKGINPEFYQAREAGLDSLLGQLKMLDLDKANPEAERLVNLENQRSGNTGNPTDGTNAVKNALQFGDERLKRSAALTNALNTANNFMGASKASFDPFGRSTATANIGGGTSINPSSFRDAGGDVTSTANNLMGNIFGYQNTAANINANRRDVLDRLNETTSSLPSIS